MSDTDPVRDWATDFDIFDPDYTSDPAPVWEDLREHCPFPHTNRGGGMWMATTYDDNQALVKETGVLSNRMVSLAHMREGRDLLDERYTEVNPPITKDPPEHTPLRRLILPFFTPQAVEGYRPFTQAVCDELIDAFINRGHCDAAGEYAQKLTPRVIGHMLGIDTGRAEEFTAWTRDLVEYGGQDVDLRAKATKTMQAFFQEMVDERRKAPTGDYISQLLAKDVNGVPVDDKLAVNLCILLLVAGIDTTWSALGSSLLHFATHEADRRRIAANPDLIPTAIEELLRFHAPVSVGRIAMSDFEFHGCPIKRGDRVMLNFPSANRDPDKFERADEVVLDRERNRHIAFGIGVHRCAGSNLARMELDAALRTWFRRIPEFTLNDPDKVTWSPGQVRGARCVPVTFG